LTVAKEKQFAISNIAQKRYAFKDIPMEMLRLVDEEEEAAWMDGIISILSLIKLARPG
jgi:hypothetical protein